MHILEICIFSDSLTMHILEICIFENGVTMHIAEICIFGNGLTMHIAKYANHYSKPLHLRGPGTRTAKY